MRAKAICTLNSMLDISLKLNSFHSVMSIADDEWDVFPESSPKRRKVGNSKLLTPILFADMC